MLRHKGEQPETIYGEKTGTKYPFSAERRVLYVDKRDAVFMLGTEIDFANV